MLICLFCYESFAEKKAKFSPHPPTPHPPESWTDWYMPKIIFCMSSGLHPTQSLGSIPESTRERGREKKKLDPNPKVDKWDCTWTPGFCCASDSVALRNTERSGNKSSVIVCPRWRHGLWESRERRKKPAQGLWKRLRSAASQRRRPDVERRSRNPQTTRKYFWDNIWGHFTLTIFQLSVRGGKWRIRYLCCSAAARVAYSADIGSKPGRFNINGRWQAW